MSQNVGVVSETTNPKSKKDLLLAIDYAHKSRWEPDGDHFYLHVWIPFSLLYPAHWMKETFSSDPAPISKVCRYAVHDEIEFVEVEPFGYESAAHWRVDIGHEDLECEECHEDTVVYCNRIYTEMLNRIRKSVLALLWSLKMMGMDRDRRILIARAVWSTRGNMDWIKLNPEQT